MGGMKFEKKVGSGEKSKRLKKWGPEWRLLDYLIRKTQSAYGMSGERLLFQYYGFMLICYALTYWDEIDDRIIAALIKISYDLCILCGPFI